LTCFEELLRNLDYKLEKVAADYEFPFVKKKPFKIYVKRLTEFGVIEIECKFNSNLIEFFRSIEGNIL
jgi:hypothetical protein